MSDPPPLPERQAISTERAWITYVRAMGFLMPGMMAMVFSRLVLLPKMQRFFEITREQWDRASVGHWFERIAAFVPMEWPAVFGVVVIILLPLEWRWARWPRYRGTVVMVITVLLNAFIVFGVVAVASAMGIVGLQAGRELAKQEATMK